ncbi:KTSC domain-containing protein [Pedobacter agri]|uniref:KTSC domain-containing protein n=1 Tax=Pedobacter agri TaxID=454586 RepID=UPI00292EA29D|nr:KTSC domain-containing protein [Pedobacter agri]
MPSSVINHFSYHADKKLLKITFVTGLVYQYQNVPLKIFKMLNAVDSKGKYFNQYIRDHFTFKKL